MALVEVKDVCVTYQRAGRAGRRGGPPRYAVQDVSLSVRQGEIVGVVGESGSGKTSLARCVAGYRTATSGTVEIDGRVVTARRGTHDRRRVQMVFQDPYASLNPRMTVRQTLREPVVVHGLRAAGQVEARVEELVDLVGLDRRYLDSRPRQLSGGQRQRASIARALALEPEVLVADEPVSALDVSVQATVLNLLADLRERLGMSILFISHDIAVVSHLCDRVVVMSQGRVVETGPVDEVFLRPEHPYTRQLLSAVPPHPWSGHPLPTSGAPRPDPGH